jgi:cytochrome c553
MKGMAMNTKTKLALSVAAATMVLGATLTAMAGRPPPKGKGIESGDYKWNEGETEQVEALGLAGDLERGEEAYEVCSACHLPSGAGRPDGTFPQLAGQHTTVIIKQMADIRAGIRDNMIMYPFASVLIDPQELADVAVYIESLAIPTDNGKGDGKALKRGKELYVRDCESCHGAHGEGDAAKFYPVLAGQHYKYMLRQALEIRDGKRRNANPEMIEVIKSYTDADIDAIVDYMSRLQMPKAKNKSASNKGASGATKG